MAETRTIPLVRIRATCFGGIAGPAFAPLA
jgi:hypothetical protein